MSFSIAGALGSVAGGAGGIASNIFGSALQAHFNRNLMNHAYFLNQKSLQESPSSARAGLEKAGFNPLLAIGGVGNSPTVSGSSVGSFPTDFVGSAKEGAMFGAVLGKAIADKKTAEAEADASKAEAGARKAEAKLAEAEADTRLSALDGITEFSAESSARAAIRSEYINSLERAAYTNSKAHAIAEDAVNAIHGGSSAFQSISHGRRDWIRGNKGR